MPFDFLFQSFHVFRIFSRGFKMVKYVIGMSSGIDREKEARILELVAIVVIWTGFRLFQYSID